MRVGPQSLRTMMIDDALEPPRRTARVEVDTLQARPSADDPAMEQALSALVACEKALHDDVTPDDLRLACTDPAVPKEEPCINLMWGGSLSRARRAKRMAIAAGASHVTQKERQAWVSGPVIQVGTLCLSCLCGVIGRGVQLLRRGEAMRTRSPDGVREDKLVRALDVFRKRLALLRPSFGEAMRHGGGSAWWERIEVLSAQFDALEHGVTGHDSVRLRGSPALRRALHVTAQQLERLCLTRVEHQLPPICRHNVVQGPG